jgi:hypothetical protein
MARFSDRMGFTKPPTSIQVDSINADLGNSIWNLIYSVCESTVSWVRAALIIAGEFSKIPLDTVPIVYPSDARQWLHDLFFTLAWHQKYNLLEFIQENVSNITSGIWTVGQFADRANAILEREMAGYRFIRHKLVPISGKAEVAAIEDAISGATHAGLPGVQTHLLASLEMLSRKPQPDYRNSVKEAISAVESAVKLIAGAETGGLDSAIKELTKRTPIHAALQTAFLKLYGYTSDESGIRHAILDEPNVGFDEAKFMLVACSAFVNFLISKASATSLLKKDQ